MAKKRIGEPAQLHAYIDQDQARQLDAVATAHQTSISDIVRRALRHYFSLPENVTVSTPERDVA